MGSGIIRKSAEGSHAGLATRKDLRQESCLPLAFIRGFRVSVTLLNCYEVAAKSLKSLIICGSQPPRGKEHLS